MEKTLSDSYYPNTPRDTYKCVYCISDNNNTNFKISQILSIYTIWDVLSQKTISRYCPFKGGGDSHKFDRLRCIERKIGSTRTSHALPLPDDRSTFFAEVTQHNRRGITTGTSKSMYTLLYENRAQGKGSNRPLERSSDSPYLALCLFYRMEAIFRGRGICRAGSVTLFI
jgi:hypothetical protein